MSDRLGTLFQDLRTDSLGTVRAPGVAAARRTVRRRRATTAGAAAVAVIGVLGGVAVAATDLPARPAPAQQQHDPERLAAVKRMIPGWTAAGVGGDEPIEISLDQRKNEIKVGCVGNGRLAQETVTAAGPSRIRYHDCSESGRWWWMESFRADPSEPARVRFSSPDSDVAYALQYVRQ